jgi:hypothetical protein
VADVNNWPKWQTTLLEVKHTSGQRTGTGANFTGIGRVMGRRWPWNLTVKEYKLNNKWSDRVVSGSSVIEEEMTFHYQQEGTNFSIKYEMRGGGLLKVFTLFVTSIMRKQTLKNINKLMTILET